MKRKPTSEPRKQRYGSKRTAARVQAIDRQRIVLREIIGGATLDEAAVAAGYAGRQGAQKARDGAIAALEAQVAELANEYRAQAERRLATAVDAIWEAVEGGELDAIDRYVRLEARWAKLRGGDAPSKFEATGRDGAPLFAPDARHELLQKLSRLADRVAPAAGAVGDGRAPDKGTG